jgi:hypothetical protein
MRDCKPLMQMTNVAKPAVRFAFFACRNRWTATCLMIAAFASVANAQVKPNAAWRQIETPNFTVIYEVGLDSLARHAALRAEHEHALLAQSLFRAPRGKIDIVLADNLDLSNGSAQPIPNNRVTIWARPPVDELSLQHYEDWLDLVISHELTHIFHLDPAGSFGRALRTVFGRVPFPWPIFPVVGIPDWNVEGLATFVESRNTNAGRVRGSYHEMVVRTSLLENAFPPIDRISSETPLWPGGSAAYIYGSLFMDYIARRYGDAAHTQLIGKMTGSVLPPPWRMDGIAKSALGRSYTDLYNDWRNELTYAYRALQDTLTRSGLTSTETITTTGRWALHPRVSHDGRQLAYADENGRDITATRVVDLSDSSDVRMRRNGLGGVAWLPDGGHITAQLEWSDRYSIGSDLYAVRDGREERLTRGARAEAPDASRDGRQIVYVQNTPGSNRLVIRDLVTGSERVIADASPDVQWTLPRFAPAGDRIAVQKWTRGSGHDVVVLDINGRQTAQLSTDGSDTAPTWTPDGRYVIFSSDRSGIANLYAHDAAGGQLRQLTNVPGGAFQPEVSPDNRFIYFSAYHADGFHIERMALNETSFRTPMRAAEPGAFRPDTLMRRAFEPSRTPTVSESRAYSPMRSLLPRYWSPFFDGDSVIGNFIGAGTSGEDAVGRHSYVAGFGYDIDHGRTSGYLGYSFAGLGNPVLSLEAAREWDNTGLVRVIPAGDGPEVTVSTFEREDRVALTASLVNRHWRASNALSLGVEGVSLRRMAVGSFTRSDPEDKLFGLVAGAGFANYRMPAQAISREDGVRASVDVRRRFELDPLESRDQSYTQLSGSGAAYKSVGGSAFAHNVIALRGSVLHRTALGGGPTDIGSPDGFLPVRGYDDDARIGFSAWTASAEYRLPLAFIARGYRLKPVFVDRTSAAFFIDAGNASCTDEQRAVYLSCAGNSSRPADVLLAGGFEVGANVALLTFYPTWMRLGIGFPFSDDAKKAQVYLTVTPAF